VSNRDRLGLTPDLTTRWATGNDNFCLFVPVGLQESFYIPQNLTTWDLPALLPIREEGGGTIFKQVHKILPNDENVTTDITYT
jgi:hypothetical protein